MAKKQNYWTDTEEQLVIDYQNAKTVDERSHVYNQLRPKLIKMYSSILLRYFAGHTGGWNRFQISEIINDCETSIVFNTLHKYNHENGKAYSYIGTSARHYFSDRLIYNRNEGRYTEALKYREPLEINADGEYNHDVAIEEEPEPNTEELLIAAKQRIDLILMNKTLDDKQKLILNCLSNYLNEIPTEYYSRHSVTYYLMKCTGLNGKTIVRYLYQLGIHDLIFVKYNFNHYEELFIENNIDENDDQQVREFLSTLKRYKYEANYQIENSAEKRALEKKKKLQNRKVPQSMGLSI